MWITPIFAIVGAAAGLLPVLALVPSRAEIAEQQATVATLDARGGKLDSKHCALGLEAIEALLQRVTLHTLHATAAPTQGTNHALTSLPIGATVFAPPILGYVLGRLTARSRASEVHRRGARILEGRTEQRRSIRSTPGTATLAGIAVPALDETKHFKLIATTGTGKSTAIREVLRTVLSRGDRALIADPDGGYLERFYRP